MFPPQPASNAHRIIGARHPHNSIDDGRRIAGDPARHGAPPTL
jgi:hypothetical protein